MKVNFFKKLSLADFFVFLILFISILAIRILLLNKITDDYTVCLRPWIEKFRSLSFKNFLLSDISNYNFSYQYILFLISKIHFSSLYLVKIVSMVFDIVLALVVAKIVGLVRDKVRWQMFAFILIFGLPTVVLNSSAWGQCDVIYTTFILLGLFLFFKKSLNWSMFYFGLALAFKLQAIFVFPIIIIIIIIIYCKKELKLKNILFLLFGLLLPSIPPLLAGRGLINTFNIYFNQFSSSSKMTYNAPNIWALTGLPFDQFNSIALWMTFIIVTVILYFVCSDKNKLIKVDWVFLMLVFSLVVPYFLPKMHERYFYVAEIMSVLYFFYNPKKWFYPVVIQICSLSNYFGYLFGATLFDLKIGGLLMGIIIISLCRQIYLRGVSKREG